MTARKKLSRRSTARVMHPAFPALEPPVKPHVNTLEQDLGLTLHKIRVLATVIALETDDPEIVADCNLDELAIAEELQQDLEHAEIARRPKPA
jgi:hypothetical protein